MPGWIVVGSFQDDKFGRRLPVQPVRIVEHFQIQHHVKAVALDAGNKRPFEVLENEVGLFKSVQLSADFMCQLRKAAAAVTPIKAGGRLGAIFQACLKI
ncbi:MAG: hypothetical protein R2830_19285 [Saprospiraceae bacterium]